MDVVRPIVEAVGYRVVGDEHDGDADLVIAAQGTAAEVKGTRKIVLRSQPDASGKKDDSIYRYDRAGLLMALKSAAGRGK